MTFELLHQVDKTLEQLGYSERVHNEPRGQMVQRLKLNSNASEVEELKHATLRLKFPPQSLEAMKMIEDSGRLKEGEDLCHTFDLSVRAFRTDNRPASPMMGGAQGDHMARLVRVRWEGT